MNKNDLKPAVVFAEFAKINEIPRPSKREEKMIEYLQKWGESHQLVAHHVHVALQNHRLAVLHTLGGRFAYNHVAGFVYFGIQLVALAPLL